MARIPLVDPEDPGGRHAVTRWNESSSGIPNVMRALANHPGLNLGFGSFLYGPDVHITPAQRELAYLTASVINNCHY